MVPFPEFDVVRSADLDGIAAALGRTPPVVLTGAHVYPASAPAYERVPCQERERPRPGPLRLYVHVPFCNYRCNFCYYATRVGDSREDQRRYVAALERELECVEPGTPLAQLFVGGGTPTAIEAELLRGLLDAIFRRMPPVEGVVHTVEASPESLAGAHVSALRSSGVGRVSMGVQSLDDAVLDAVHRRHDRDQVYRAVDLLLEGGLIANVDLIYGLPGQTPESFRSDLEAVVGRGVHSVTLYDLRTSTRTPLGRALSESERMDLLSLIRWRAFVEQATADLGLTQTRWHTFKRLDSIAARHQREPCFDADARGFQLGIGMSARSHLGFTIYRNHAGMREYVRRVEAGASPVEERYRLGEADRRTQLVAQTLGDCKPLERRVYQESFGRPIESDFGDVLERMRGAGLIADDGDRLVLSPLGRLVYDRVMINFYPEHAREWLWAQAA